MSLPPPRRTPAAWWLSIVGALALAALGVVLLQAFLVDRGWASGEAWIHAALTALDGRAPDAQTTTLGVVAGVAGLLILIAGLNPARRSHLRVDHQRDLWISRRALAAVAEDAADRTTDVSESSVEIGRRAVTVVAEIRPGAEGVVDTLEETVQERLSGLLALPIRVRIKEERL